MYGGGERGRFGGKEEAEQRWTGTPKTHGERGAREGEGFTRKEVF